MPPSRTVKTHKKVHPYRHLKYLLQDEFDSGTKISSFDIEYAKWKFSFEIGVALNKAQKEDPHAMDTSA
ncbi:hypothetical protein BT96DRAFT_1007051 [Gymnopus androsaceus JB14]|uniref:Uncharacterized protein n=1 Tax=Gymnopus androsaceus JB14 TaxID=1447944 RepID=A0A6A4GJ92_9AGAR|nr:hypothetical protein BT96DRAFT_1008249 [Gymnopus androsaceus JB14]KAE9385437.1 hypothetical protein BT96DRAFT_1007051 [Gymnopus androsaceus JB14]